VSYLSDVYVQMTRVMDELRFGNQLPRFCHGDLLRPSLPARPHPHPQLIKLQRNKQDTQHSHNSNRQNQLEPNPNLPVTLFRLPRGAARATRCFRSQLYNHVSPAIIHALTFFPVIHFPLNSMGCMMRTRYIFGARRRFFKLEDRTNRAMVRASIARNANRQPASIRNAFVSWQEILPLVT